MLTVDGVPKSGGGGFTSIGLTERDSLLTRRVHRHILFSFMYDFIYLPLSEYSEAFH